jgi:hypothetical protein
LTDQNLKVARTVEQNGGGMTIDLDESELVLLFQLVNQHVVQLQRTQLQRGGKLEGVATPFEAQLLQKLITADQDAVMAKRAR